MGMISEFKEFALKGSLVDMAVGIVMGGAIGKLVGSLVSNLINPIVSIFTGPGGFDGLKAKIGEAPKVVDGVAQMAADGTTPIMEPQYLNYGAFITSFIDFLILAFVIFMIIKMVNNAKNAMGLAEEEAPAGPSEVDLLTEIRDSLKR